MERFSSMQMSRRAWLLAVVMVAALSLLLVLSRPQRRRLRSRLRSMTGWRRARFSTMTWKSSTARCFKATWSSIRATCR